MSEINKTYRIKTDIGTKEGNKYITLDANLVQDYDVFDILSVKINSVDTYKIHNANYGVVVGRVLANNGFGIPNAKLSIFISADSEDGEKIRDLYPFSNTSSKDKNGVRYNLLPNEKVNDCHQVVGTFPSKRYALDNDVVLEVFEKYYKYTTRTNNAGDYLIMGVPVGTHTLHMDLDLSDCGILSQRPRDFIYKGYTIEQFENPNMFKEGTTYSNLSQIFTQDQVVNVQPFWGNSSLGEKIGITRADIDVAFKFEPTCVFIGSVVSDNSSQGISKKCIPTENMGNMEELTTGEGTIEMIRKTPGGSVEEFQVKGTQLINSNGIWCYQIPMNLDYMMTDEYGNMVPTDDPEKGIPTRTKVRFRISMQDNEENVDNYFRAKVLVPHNPQNLENSKYEDYDYEFGSLTREDSFRDLFWNNVYSVKSYIPRFQKRKVGGWKEKKFTGIKNCNFYGSNNPMPYNNIRIKLPFMFTVMCALIKVFIFIISIINSLTAMLGNFLSDIGNTGFFEGKVWSLIGVDPWYPFHDLYKRATELSMSVLKDGLCPDLENWYFAPMYRKKDLWSPPDEVPTGYQKYDLLNQTLQKIRNASADDDIQSIDVQNNEEKGSNGEEPVCLTIHTDYLIACVEMNLAMEYRVINFDFYNDWVNGTLYFPRFMRYIRPKKTFLGITFARAKVKGCMDDTKIFSKTRRYTQQCALGYKNYTLEGRNVYTNVENPNAKKKMIKVANNLHKQRGLSQKAIFGKNGGICHEHSTLRGQYVYYMKPCEWTYSTTPNAKKVNLFATDLILLGSLNDCDLNGIPQAFKYLSSSSYIMPTNLALTNMENNGYLYVTEKGTICTGKSQLDANDIKNESKIEIMSPNDGLMAEILAFSGAQDSNYNVQYEGNELSDIIALTEAAGIAWNYTGPGQGEDVPEKLYYPGGHFLGLSCVHSQTNIKSCINLTRICEVGANMSQRKEDVTGLDDSGNLTYTYSVPTGFISGDDIVGDNFRTMFATMNYKRLIATKINPLTGYKMYDMDFVKPINFDGAFKSVITSDNGLYNSAIALPNEFDGDKKSFWEAIGIDFNVDSRPDYDAKENTNTQTRTIEDTSIDYYLYRFGLTYEELKKNNNKHLRKFLYSIGNKMYLPQYENSYYFYFGLKNGATALDEFNKQFFSECTNGMLVTQEPTISISVDGELDMNTATAALNITTNNLEVPYQYIEIESNVAFTDKGEKKLVVQNGDNETAYDHWLINYMFVLGTENEGELIPWKCPFGTYTVTIRDANNVVYTKTEKIGMDILSFESAAYDFNTTKNLNDDELFRGGYIKVSNIKIGGLPDGSEDFEGSVKTLNIVVKNNEGTNVATAEFKNGEIKDIILKVGRPGEYELYVEYDSVKILMQTFIIKDTSDLKLFIGDPNVEVKDISDYTYGWWTGMTGNTKWIERVSTFNEIKNREEEASTIKVYGVGGIKAVWGLPQNNKGIVNSNGVCSSEDATMWPNNTTVDDEYVHYPTYAYNGTPVEHFSALVYDDTRVMGDYCAKMVNGSVSNIGTNPLKKGCGYIFKPVPDGDLQFHVYNGSTFTANTVDESGEIENGVFYPSISYPSVDRPFYAQAKFYCWERRAIEMVVNEGGQKKPTIMDYEEGGKTEIKIYNGITYNNRFFALPKAEEKSIGVSSTYISNLEHLKENNKFIVTQNDMNGAAISVDRETVYKDYNSNVTFGGKNNTYIEHGESGITTYYYGVYGGAKDADDAQIVNSIYDSVESLFANYVTFVVDDNQLINGPFPVGAVTDKNATYYMACDDGTFLELTSNKYLYIEEGAKTNYLYCTYTSASTYDTEGEPVMVTITVDNRKRPDKANCTFNRKDSYGTIYEYCKTKIKIDKNNNDNDIEVFEVVFNNVPEIEGVKDYRIKRLKNADGSLKDWEPILKAGNERFLANRRYDKNKVYYAYSIINGENDTLLYKVYPVVIKVNKIKESDMMDIKVMPNIISAATKGETRKISIIAGNTSDWVASYNSTWFSLSKTNGYGTMDIYVKIEPNNTKETRSEEISFRYANESSGNNDVIIVITQEPDTEAGDDDSGDTTEPIEVKVKYTPNSFGKSGTLTEKELELKETKLLFNNFNLKDVKDKVWVELPNVNIKQFDFISLPDAQYDNDVLINYEIREINNNKIVGSSSKKVNEVNTYDFEDICFVPVSDGKYELQVTYIVRCDDPYGAGEQRINFAFESENNTVYYRYYK